MRVKVNNEERGIILKSRIEIKAKKVYWNLEQNMKIEQELDKKNHTKKNNWLEDKRRKSFIVISRNQMKEIIMREVLYFTVKRVLSVNKMLNQIKKIIV